MLKVEKLKVHGLAPLTFTVAGGQCLTIEGPSGSGKSILLRAIADLDPATGKVFLDDVERRAMSAMAWRRNVRYFAAEPGWWGATPRDHFTDTVRARELMTALDLEPAKLDQQITSLSTGERQRLALIRGLADAPAVMAFDEPTSALDDRTAARVEALIAKMRDDGACVLLVSHDRSLLERMGTARLVLRGMATTSVEPMAPVAASEKPQSLSLSQPLSLSGEPAGEIAAPPQSGAVAAPDSQEPKASPVSKPTDKRSGS